MRLRRNILCALLREQGASLLEMAFSSIILLALTIGIIESCFALYTSHATANAARQATRWAMVRGSTSCTNTPALAGCDATSADIESYVAGLGYLNIPTSDVTVTFYTASGTQPTTWSVCASGTCNTPGNAVQVTVTHPFPFSLPFVSPQTLSITSTSQVVIAQ